MFLGTRTERRQVLRPPGAERPERRAEQRLRYGWPIWYSSDGSLNVQQGRLVDLSRGGASFLAPVGSYPEPGDEVWVRSSYPLVDEGAFGMASFTTSGLVLRSERAGPLRRRIAVAFSAPLAHCPVHRAREVLPALGPTS
jgi:hypothetical protein